MVEQGPIGGQQAVELGEVRIELTASDVLEHSHGSNGIELTGDVPVVLNLDGHAIAQPFLAHSELRLGRLLRA